MTNQEQQAVLADFREWSGGFEPSECDGQQIATYIESSLDPNYNKQEVLALLTTPVCTCIPGTGYRDPSCDVHGDERGEA